MSPAWSVFIAPQQPQMQYIQYEGFLSGFSIFVAVVAFLLGRVTPCHHAKAI